MQRLGLKSENSTKFRITGIRADGKIVDKESAALIFWAWRALYAETVRAHLENKPMRLDRAYAYTIELAHARVRAHGFRWRQWYLRQRYIPSARSKVIPERHRSYKLLKTDPYGTYQVNPILAQERSTTLTFKEITTPDNKSHEKHYAVTRKNKVKLHHRVREALGRLADMMMTRQTSERQAW
jgi:hypothetical protein